jgi:hypothetical protein
MTTTFEEANTKLRQAVEIRREAQAAGKPHEEWYETMQAKGGATAEDIIERFGNVSQPATNAVEPVGNSEQLEHLREYRAYPMTPDELDEALERLAGDGILKEQPGSLPFLERARNTAAITTRSPTSARGPSSSASSPGVAAWCEWPTRCRG